ncbi:MAG TPA: tripartite tricarboxylate transporter substrate binding protein [Xanthobacteraceae bacterium]|jgi:tripartite-type tricarboxylate transporter receptor subunit TctC|nr:tripartite tricarboxylate transporter substrate binding protein [Xanthobacteraceae bacterium]
MSIVRRRFLKSTLAAPLILASAIASGRAETDYPTRPIRLIVGFGPGGGTDILARLVGAKLSEILGQSVVVENRPGASARLAAEYVAGQPADGYTLLASPVGPMSMAAAIYPDLKYDPIKSFVPLAMIGQFPEIFVVAADTPVKSVKELVQFAKQHPDKANYPSTSPAFTIPMEELKLASGMPGVTVPYKSSGEMVLSVIEGQSMMAVIDPPPTLPQVKAKKLKALAVTGNQRMAELPDVPSMAEAGFPTVDTQLWSGTFAPIATPPAIVSRLQKALSKAIQDPGVAMKLKALAVGPGVATPEAFKHVIESEITKYKAVIKAANLHFT